MLLSQGNELKAAAGCQQMPEKVGDFRRDASRDAEEFMARVSGYIDPVKTKEFEYKEDAPTVEQFLTKAPTLTEQLEWQLHMDSEEGAVRDAAEVVIGNLDPDGRLNATNEEIAMLGGWSEEIVEQARAVVMRLEPVGCGARDVRECLMAQLETRGETERLATEQIREHLSELQQHKLPHLSADRHRHRNISGRAVIPTLILSGQTLYIGRTGLISGDQVKAEGSEYVIFCRWWSAFAHQTYQTMPSRDDDQRPNHQGKMRSAVDLLRNINRRQTIYRVVESIVNRQRDFR